MMGALPDARRILAVLFSVLAFMLLPARATGAETLRAPIGGKAISLGERTLCRSPPAG
jgi:hypothetical protein